MLTTRHTDILCVATVRVTMMRALDDLRVIELSESAAAAFAGRLFADAGAEVVLVEPPDGHPLRHVGPFRGGRPSVETSAPHLHTNAGKRSVRLDIEKESGMLAGLLASAPIFITDFGTDDLEGVGLAWRQVQSRLPSLVMTQITPHGNTGPYRGYEGTNLTALALGGQLKITGERSREPLGNYGSQAEYQAGLAAFAGTLANLLLAEESGGGEYLDLSVQDVVATNLDGWHLTANLGVMAERSGLNVSAVYGVYPCADGWVYLSALAPSLWEQLKRAAKLPELDDERFATQQGRLELNDELEAVLTGWTMSKTSDELRALAQEGYPVTVAETPDRLLESEQWRNRRFAHTVSHAEAGEISVLGAPWYDGEPEPPGPAPLLGEANEEILGALKERA